MTTTKALYLIAAIVPFGLVILGAVALGHTLLKQRRARQAANALAVT